eukprot:8652610-Pyramimonas_sp.AAC.1
MRTEGALRGHVVFRVSAPSAGWWRLAWGACPDWFSGGGGGEDEETDVRMRSWEKAGGIIGKGVGPSW